MLTDNSPEQQNIALKPLKTKMLNYINVFRAMAILLIVAGHSFVVANTNAEIAWSFFSGTFAFGTTLFVFIAGFLFQHLSYKYEFITYIKKKFINVILPYIITSIPGIILCFTIPVLYKNIFWGWKPEIFQVIALLTTGVIHNGPTWYIPMTTLFFLCASLLLFLEKKEILYKILPYLLIFFAVTQRIRGYIDYEDIMYSSYLVKYLYYIGYFLTGFIHYLPIYILGMYFSSEKKKILLLYKYRYLLIFLTIVSWILNIYLSYKFHFYNGDISKVFLTLCILGYLRRFDKKIMKHKIINSVADFIAKYSFGIFFMHMYMLKLFSLICNKWLPVLKVVYVNSYSGVFKALCVGSVRFVFALVSSILICYLIKKLLNKLGIKNTRAVIGA